MASRKIAEFVHSLEYSSLPPHLAHIATRCFYNYVGCAIGGSKHPTTLKAIKTFEAFFGRATSTLLGAGTAQADAQHAALINGIASHVHDYDDTHLETIIHPTGPVASALLAYAEHKGGVNGQDFLLALIAGIEAECKIGISVWPEHYDMGWHITSTVGSIGVALAVGKLLKLSIEQLQHAIGIASVQVTGLREMFGSDTKSFHPGRAAQNGLLAAMLAGNDYTSSLTALEAKRGWANCVSSRNSLDESVAGLGKGIWEIEKNAFKPFPCGIVCHPAIDACIQLQGDLQQCGIDVSMLESLELRVHPLVIELTNKKNPKNGLEGKFSVFHGCAVGLLYGRASPVEYADSVVRDAAVISIRDKIAAKADEKVAADETFAVLKLQDGGRLEKHVKHAIGSLEVPMDDEELSRKFVDQCTLVLGHDGARRASEACWSVARIADIRHATQHL